MVILEADVPSDAIFCAPDDLSRSWSEREYMVDRRKLGAVRVLERLH